MAKNKDRQKQPKKNSGSIDSKNAIKKNHQTQEADQNQITNANDSGERSTLSGKKGNNR